ncbi:MAG: GNAT family N-acetyltransferase, partial [Promethearchaeota archaeon]
DPWQRLGLGSKMLDYMIEICIERGLDEIYGIMLPDNYRAHHLMEKMGFSLKRTKDNLVEARLNLRLERQWRKPRDFGPHKKENTSMTNEPSKSKKRTKKS